MEDSRVWKWERSGKFSVKSVVRLLIQGGLKDPVYKEPSLTVPGMPAIVQHEILNNRRQVLTKDAAGSVKLWEITKGIVIEDYGKVSFDEKKEELFEMVSIPAWFTVDTRLGSLSVHLDTPQCFSAEMYAVDLNILGASEELKRDALGIWAAFVAEQHPSWGGSSAWMAKSADSERSRPLATRLGGGGHPPTHGTRFAKSTARLRPDSGSGSAGADPATRPDSAILDRRRSAGLGGGARALENRSSSLRVVKVIRGVRKRNEVGPKGKKVLKIGELPEDMVVRRRLRL
ncbi:hypothetical protein Taro_032770 [Colocasia esculenta]|uniref:Uncharacterized protein n=1 Tax=Colocasia esculenta TaxID=4460 RepID=A0A843VTJ0_COLES|nr:hypothetical protein [Colocasia esculenta]